MRGKRKAWSLALLTAALALWAWARYSPLPDRELLEDRSPEFLDREGGLLRLELSPRQRYCVPVPLGKVSPKLVAALVAYEDRWFWWHPGINPVAVGRALFLDLEHGRRISGASTLTLQLAKLLERKPRTFGSKLVEAWRAIQLEARYPKRRILEMYLNAAPMGGNIQGVEAASWIYFGKPSSALSYGEAALLVGLPRSPTARRPDKHPGEARRGRDRVLERILPILRPGIEEARAAMAAEVPTRRHPLPHGVAALAARLRREAPPGGSLSLALDPGMQALAERELSRAVGALLPQGVHNGAVLLVDNHSLRVLAYVGSPDPGDPRGGQINGADILRSPGSSLKPFLYARALEEGLITPRTRLADIPRDFDGFRPADYEGHYDGMVPAEECLARSLNIPAAGLEAELQGRGLEEWLRRVGADTRGRATLDPGLSVVLGAWPVTLEENVAFYAALANCGRLRPLRFLDEAQDPGPPAEGKAVLTPESSYLVAEMLARVERPDLPASWEYSPTRSKIAFKTGTSYGFRDAWAIGFTPDYTCGVWLGNADARGAAPLKGASAAAPVLFAVLNPLTRNRDAWFSRPKGLGRRRVCALTGEKAGEDCQLTEEDDTIVGVSSEKTCSVHRRLWVRKRDGVQVSVECLAGPESDYEEKVFAVWPQDVTRFLRASGRDYDAIPPSDPDCAGDASLAPPRITSPLPTQSYRIHPGVEASSQRLPLGCEAGPDIRRVYWFVDGTLYYQGPPDQVFFFLCGRETGKSRSWMSGGVRIPPGSGSKNLRATG
jgi:penicillin-binding protein 1C